MILPLSWRTTSPRREAKDVTVVVILTMLVLRKVERTVEKEEEEEWG